MALNAKKTKTMLMGSSRKLSLLHYELQLYFDDECLNNVNTHKLLGVHLDKSLNWTSQVDKICSVFSSRIALLNRLKTYLPIEGLKLYYNGYLLPLIDYCSVVWGNTNKVNSEKIPKLQKRAARIILRADFNTPSKKLFEKLEWLTVYNRIHYHKANPYVYKCINNLCSMFNSINENCPYGLRSATLNNLQVPRPKSEYFKRTFLYSGTNLWNSLPSNIKRLNNEICFKTKVKDYLLRY
jgi:hypothetical protein